MSKNKKAKKIIAIIVAIIYTIASFAYTITMFLDPNYKELSISLFGIISMVGLIAPIILNIYAIKKKKYELLTVAFIALEICIILMMYYLWMAWPMISTPTCGQWDNPKCQINNK